MTQLNLRALPSLKDFTNAELRLLASVAPAREFQQDMVLCREGAIGASCFLLATGEVHVTKKTEKGEKIMATLRAGAIVGQMALVDRAPRSASVSATQPCIALELTRDVFDGLLRSASPLALRFQEQIALAGIRQLRMATQRLATIMGGKSSTAVAKTSDVQPVPRPQSQPINSRPQPLPANLWGSAAPAESERSRLLQVQAALDQWDMQLGEDLSEVRVVVPEGQVTAAEMRARMR